MAEYDVVGKVMKFWCYSIVVVLIINGIDGERILDRIYDPIQGDMACFKRFNGTHEIGCGSAFSGNVGVLHLIDDDESFQWFLRKGPHSYYVLVILPQYFTSTILETAWKSNKLSGVLLIDPKNVTRPSNFSGENTCPNERSSLYKETTYDNYCKSNPWNPYGSSLLYMNWQFPIFYINDEKSIEYILNCYNKFNRPSDDGEPRDWPLCAVQLKSNMFGTTNSKVCMRRNQSLFSAFSRNFCDPLEDINIWNSIQPLNKTIEEKSVIIVATSADASTMFDNISPGAESAVSGLVALLATAEALGKYADQLADASKNIIFVIYEGDSWDYIGSSRMVYDMANNEFPNIPLDNQEDQMSILNLTHIDAVIDLKQLGLANSNNGRKEFHFHSDPISSKNVDISQRNDELFESLKSEARRYNFDILKSTSDIPLPPSSLQSFLKKQNISGFVLTDHRAQYRNKYDNSIFDDSDNGYDQFPKDLTDLASSLASSLFNLVTDKNIQIEADIVTVTSLLYCYKRDINCTYFRSHSDSKLIHALHHKPAKMYVSVQLGEIHISYLTAKLLSYYIGHEVDVNETMCKSNNTQVSTLEYYPFLDNGTCIISSMHTSNALSPAFLIENYDWESGEYSTWTESTWQETDARIFLKPSQKEEISLVVGGIFSVTISFFIIYFLNARAGLIFLEEVVPTPC